MVFASHVHGTPAHGLARHLVGLGWGAGTLDFQSREAWLGGPARRFLARARALGVFPLRAALELTSDRPDVVVATTNPPDLPWAVLATRPLHGARVVVLAYDLYPDALEAAGLVPRGGPVSRALERLQARVFSAADAVVFLGDALARHACGRYGTPRRWAVLETGADLAGMEAPLPPRAPDPWEAACAGKLVLSYVGQLGRMHEWETLAALLPRLPPGVEAIFLGAGWGMKRLFNNRSGSVHHLGTRSDDTWRRVLAASDLALVTLTPGGARASFPSKAYSALAAGVPILAVAPRESDLAHLVESNACGIVCEPGDAEGVLRALGELQSDPSRLDEMRANAKRAARERYDHARLAERWAELLDEVVATARPRA